MATTTRQVHQDHQCRVCSKTAVAREPVKQGMLFSQMLLGTQAPQQASPHHPQLPSTRRCHHARHQTWHTSHKTWLQLLMQPQAMALTTCNAHTEWGRSGMPLGQAHCHRHTAWAHTTRESLPRNAAAGCVQPPHRRPVRAAAARMWQEALGGQHNAYRQPHRIAGELNACPQQPCRAAGGMAACQCVQPNQTAVRSHPTRSRVKVVARVGQGEAGPPGLDPDRLITLLTRMAEAQKAPESEWCDMLYAATFATARSLNSGQRLGLVSGLVQLGIQPPADWLDLMLQVDMSSPAPDLMELWAMCQLCGHNPGQEWVWQVMEQLAMRVSELDGVQAAVAVTMAVQLAAPTGDGDSGDDNSPGMQLPREQLAAWLDVMAIRMVETTEEEGAENLPSEALVAVAAAFTQTFRHQAPAPWLQLLSSASLRTDLGPQGSVHVAVSLAAARQLPDLVLAPQVYMQTVGELSRLPPSLACDLVWAVATWHVGKEGGTLDRFDMRPPARWWDEWFQATGVWLRDHSLGREVLVRLMWSLAVLRVRPPQAWLIMLVNELTAMLLAGSLTPLELLYLTRSGDMLYGMLLGVDTGVAKAGAGAGAGTGTAFSSQGAGTGWDTGAARAQGGGNRVGPVQGAGVATVGGAPNVLRPAGVTAAYAPPDALAALVRDCSQRLTTAPLPPGWRRINTRFPPYSLPARGGGNGEEADAATGEEEEGVQGGDVVGVGRAGSGTPGAVWQGSEAARRIYGPLTPPAWR